MDDIARGVEWIGVAITSLDVEIEGVLPWRKRARRKEGSSVEPT